MGPLLRAVGRHSHTRRGDAEQTFEIPAIAFSDRYIVQTFELLGSRENAGHLRDHSASSAAARALRGRSEDREARGAPLECGEGFRSRACSTVQMPASILLWQSVQMRCADEVDDGAARLSRRRRQPHAAPDSLEERARNGERPRQDYCLDTWQIKPLYEGSDPDKHLHDAIRYRSSQTFALFTRRISDEQSGWDAGVVRCDDCCLSVRDAAAEGDGTSAARVPLIRRDNRVRELPSIERGLRRENIARNETTTIDERARGRTRDEDLKEIAQWLTVATRRGAREPELPRVRIGVEDRAQTVRRCMVGFVDNDEIGCRAHPPSEERLLTRHLNGSVNVARSIRLKDTRSQTGRRDLCMRVGDDRVEPGKEKNTTTASDGGRDDADACGVRLTEGGRRLTEDRASSRSVCRADVGDEALLIFVEAGHVRTRSGGNDTMLLGDAPSMLRFGHSPTPTHAVGPDPLRVDIATATRFATNSSGSAGMP